MTLICVSDSISSCSSYIISNFPLGNFPLLSRVNTNFSQSFLYQHFLFFLAFILFLPLETKFLKNIYTYSQFFTAFFMFCKFYNLVWLYLSARLFVRSFVLPIRLSIFLILIILPLVLSNFHFFLSFSLIVLPWFLLFLFSILLFPTFSFYVFSFIPSVHWVYCTTSESAHPNSEVIFFSPHFHCITAK